jgi:Leucine-rich repeat (LRR) protein
MSSDGDEILSKWPPQAVVCVIDDALLAELTGLDVHDSHYDDDLAQVTSLDLHLRDGAKGKIRRIESLSRLPRLQQLNLSHNALTKMEGLGSLLGLLELNLAENSLSRIEGIFHMKQLERLNLCGNRIERIPSSIASLTSLSALRLNRNRLSDWRDLQHFRDMHSLKNLRIDNNLFPAPPALSSSSSSSLRQHILSLVTPALEVLDNEPVTATDR